MIPLAPIERIAKKTGAERISLEAIKELQKILDEIGLEITLESASIARYTKRKTILKKDIQLTARKI